MISSLTFPFQSITIGELGSTRITASPERVEREVKVPIHFEATAVFDGTIYKDIRVTSPSFNQGMGSMLNALGYSSSVLDVSKS